MSKIVGPVEAVQAMSEGKKIRKTTWTLTRSAELIDGKTSYTRESGVIERSPDFIFAWDGEYEIIEEPWCSVGDEVIFGDRAYGVVYVDDNMVAIYSAGLAPLSWSRNAFEKAVRENVMEHRRSGDSHSKQATRQE